MKQPAYHLRANKAVDRLTLIDVIKRASTLDTHTGEYTYYGFGGPYLEDFRLLYEFYPEIRMISIENNDEIYKRQVFHMPCHSSQLKLKKTEFKSFLDQYDGNNEKSIFWLDYLDLRYAWFDEFMELLTKVSNGSIIKITLRCEPGDYIDKCEVDAGRKKAEFRDEFRELLPHSTSQPPADFAGLAKLLQDMIRIAAQKTLSAIMASQFFPISSFRYADGAGMFSLTGMVCAREDVGKAKHAFGDWHLRNLNWGTPSVIDVPTLSTKERLHLQRRLPCDRYAGRVLRRALGYLIDNDIRRTEGKLRQYADFHRYSPYFMKAVP
ncbi:MAG TPA: O-methyltransferase [Terriglobales bacterium]|nr:O-methyltransferase [Terriglobales bacterium]